MCKVMYSVAGVKLQYFDSNTGILKGCNVFDTNKSEAGCWLGIGKWNRLMAVLLRGIVRKCVTRHRTMAPENSCLFHLWDLSSNVLHASSN